LPKVIRNSNPDFRINSDSDVCRIAAKMLWIDYLVGEFREKRPVYVLFCNGEGSGKVIRNLYLGSDHQ